MSKEKMSLYTKFIGHKFRIPRAFFTLLLFLGLVLVSGIVAAIEFSDTDLI